LCSAVAASLGGGADTIDDLIAGVGPLVANGIETLVGASVNPNIYWRVSDTVVCVSIPPGLGDPITRTITTTGTGIVSHNEARAVAADGCDRSRNKPKA
jgi:hypothetical protein